MKRASLFTATIMLTMAASSHASTLVYSIAGIGEARTQSYAFDFGTGEYVERPSNTFFGEGPFTAIFRANLSNLPPNNPPAGGAFDYTSYGGAPNFFNSSTSAFIGGQEFGLISNGSIYSRVSSPYGFSGAYIISDVVSRLDYTNPLRTYYASGALKTETTYESYNQFYSYSGGSIFVQNVALPDFANGGSIQSVFTQNVQSFDEDGTRRINNFTTREFLGNGTVTLSIETTAVPEPTNWALMIAGFGLIGISLRRRSGATVAA